MDKIIDRSRHRTHCAADLVRRSDRYRSVAARALATYPPSIPKAYGRQPGVSRTGISRAMHGDESNWLYRGLAHFAALAELGDGPQSADLSIGLLRRERLELWADLDTIDCRLLDEYCTALHDQADAAEQLAACLRAGRLQTRRTHSREDT